MIGKIKKFNYKSLFFLILIALGLNAYLYKNIYFIVIFVVSFLISILSTKYGLEIIKKFELLQNIREEGPLTHLRKKNTPTMGGVFLILPFLFSLIIANYSLNSSSIPLTFLFVSCFFIIGFLDDYLSIKNKQNRGLRSNEKLLLQGITTIFFIFLASQNDFLNSTITISNNWSVDTGIMIFPIVFFTLIGLSNAVNLTDGLDGLASGCSAIVFYGLGTEILLNGEKELIIYSVLSYMMSGLCMGFLKYNKYPAKIFMGDTGSLTIGATLGSISILTNSFITLFIISGIFIAEAYSVILQVTFFKITKKLFKNGKKIFLMSPLHHHYELKGIKEEKIVENFWKVNILLVILGIVLKINL